MNVVRVVAANLMSHVAHPLVDVTRCKERVHVLRCNARKGNIAI
jgi:hypothetical protein